MENDLFFNTYNSLVELESTDWLSEYTYVGKSHGIPHHPQLVLYSSFELTSLLHGNKLWAKIAHLNDGLLLRGPINWGVV